MVELKDLENSLGMKITEKLILNKQIGQLKKIQNVIGKDRVKDMIDSQRLSQAQKDYIYLKMGWL
jgi:hypothetical protein